MLRITALICLFLLSFMSQANPQSTLYQVDMIVFAHKQVSKNDSSNTTPVLVSDMRQAIELKNTASSALTPYHTLPASSSQLSSEYWALTRKSNYQILAHYSWLQPANNQRPIAFSATNRNGWNLEGTVRVRRSNYYLLDTDLVFSTPGQNPTTFSFAQKQRLKPGTVYYLDHPQAGVLIKVHQVT